MHPTPANPAPEQPIETLRREGEYKGVKPTQLSCNIQRYCVQLLDTEPSSPCLIFVDNKSDTCLLSGELIVITTERDAVFRWLLQSISHLAAISCGAV